MFIHLFDLIQRVVLAVRELFSHERSFADDLDDQLPIPRAVVKVDEDDLLPCPKLHPATDKRHREARTEQRCPYVGVPVAITPSQIVRILDVLRRWSAQAYS